MWSTFEKGPICYIPNPERPWEKELGLNPFYRDMGLPETLSFDEHIQGHYEDEICDCIRDQINDGYLKPGKGTRFISEPDRVGCARTHISNLRYRQKDLRVYFQATVVASLNLYARLGEMEVKDQRKEWFLVDGMWDAGNENYNMTWGDARVYRRGDEPEGRVLTEYLIPQFNWQQIRDEAVRILRLYIPEALEKAMRISGKLLAERMGLKVRYLQLASHDKSLGLLFFRKGSVEVIDRATGEITQVAVEAGTIIVNGRLVGRDDRKRIDMTIIHECVHKIEHELFYRLQRLYYEDIAFLPSPNYVGDDDNPNDPVRWIEWQAREITRCVQMPATTMKMKITELLSAYSSRRSVGGRARTFERLVKDIADFYGVSRYQAKKRLVALGYEEVQGVLNYVNGAYVPAFSFASGKIRQNQTYTIEFAEAFAEYERNEKFREILKEGHFVYVEGHFCINHPKYIEQHGGKLRMTAYGRERVDECCLVFDVKHQRPAPKYVDGVLRSDVVVGGKSEVNADLREAEMKAAHAREMGTRAVKTSQILINLPTLFTKTLTEHMAQRNVTIEELAARTGLSERSISDYRNKEDEHPGLKVVVALCIGLHLEPDFSEDLIRKSGSSFKLSAEETMYKFILRGMYGSTVDECNACLVAAGFKPLTKGVMVA